MKNFSQRKFLSSSLLIVVFVLTILIYKEARASSYFRIDINQDDCIGCGVCIAEDPVGYLTFSDEGKAIFRGSGSSKVFEDSNEFFQYYYANEVCPLICFTYWNY